MHTFIPLRKYGLVVILSLSTLVAMAQKSSYNIGMLLDYRTEELEPLLLQLQKQIKVVVGEDADIYFPSESILTNNFDLRQAEANYQQLLANNTDIIIAFGEVNNLIIHRQTSYPKPIILFGAVNRDLVNVD